MARTRSSLAATAVAALVVVAVVRMAGNGFIPASKMAYAKVIGCAAGVYALWFLGVVRPATRQAKIFGPRWLARFASGILYSFGTRWINFSIDTEDAIKKKKFDTEKQYIMIWHPHGLAEYLLLVNARSVDGKTLARVVEKGYTIGIQPGGIHEQVHTDANKEVVYLPARLGFIRLAMKNGLPLLPLYCFGENQMYDTSEFLRRINIWLYKTFKCGTLFVHGLFGIPQTPCIPNPLMLPMPGRGLHLRWGEPVETGAADADPSDEKVLEVYKRYCEALQKIFNTHKDQCLPPAVAAKGLEIVLRTHKKKD